MDTPLLDKLIEDVETTRQAENHTYGDIARHLGLTTPVGYRQTHGWVKVRRYKPSAEIALRLQQYLKSPNRILAKAGKTKK